MARESIVIKNFQNGIAPSSYLGFEEIRGLNIIDKPGVIFPNKALTKESFSTVTDLIIDSTIDNQGQVWAISAAKLYKRTTGGTWSSITLPGGGSSGTHKGIAFWGATTSRGFGKPKGWIFLLAGTTIDLLDLGNETSWTKNWGPLGGTANDLRPTFVASDNRLYMGNGYNDLISLTEETVDNFDPATAATYTLNLSALDLPTNYVVRDINELGSKLMVCAGKSGNNNSADIFPWDKTSASFFNPIFLHEDGDSTGWQTLVIGLTMYIHAGKRGNWYVTNGSSAQLFAKIPKTLTDLDPASTIIYRSAIAKINNAIYFGLGSNGTQRALGVYSLDPVTRRFNFEYVLSPGTSDDSMEIGMLESLGNDKFVVGWSDGDEGTFGVDEVGGTGYASDLAFFTTQFLSMGLSVQENSFNRPEIRLARPMVSGDSLRVWYRRQQGGSWTLHYTGGRVGFQNGFMPPIGDIKDIQFKVSLNGVTELLDITLI